MSSAQPLEEQTQEQLQTPSDQAVENPNASVESIHGQQPQQPPQQQVKQQQSASASVTMKMQQQTFSYSMPLHIKQATNSVGVITGGVVVGGAKSAQKLFAKAIYDNLADTPDELAFKKGDILTVIEQDTEGIQGWWLCTLRGRQGLCPGNRLRILNSYDSGCFSPSPASSPSPSLAASTATLNSSICSAETYENGSIISGASGSSAGSGSGSGSGVISASQTQLHHQQQQQQHHQLHHHQHQHHHHHNHNHSLQPASLQQQQQQQQQYRQGTRRSWHVSPNKVITPQRYGDVYIYNCSPASIPSSTAIQQQQQQQQQQQLLRAQQLQQQQIYSNQSIYQNLSMMSSTTSSNGSGHEFETYDVPKPATPVNNYDCPKSICRTPTSSATASNTRFDAFKSAAGTGCNVSIEEESYDVPRPLNTSLLQHQHNLTPSSSNSSLLTSDSLSLSFSSSNRSSLANMPDYDIPRRNPLPVRAVHQLAAQQRQSQQLTPNANANCMTYDFPVPAGLVVAAQQQDKSQTTPNGGSTQLGTSSNNHNSSTKELPLELNSALETLAKLQSETTSAITRLLSFVVPNWRAREKLEPIVMELKLAAVRLRTALHDLTEFSEGALGNASRSEDRNLALKLRPLVRALRDADKLIHDSSEVLEAQGGWTLEHLTRNDDKSACKPPDSLDQLIACAQTLTEDVRSTTSFVQGNASLLFKRQLPNSSSSTDVLDNAGANSAAAADAAAVAAGAGNRSSSAEWLEDYDYVSFESKDAAAKKNSALREAIPANMKKKFDTVIKAAECSVMATTNAVPAATNAPAALPANMTDKDKMLVRYYAKQISTHMGNLRQAIDSFLETVEKNQPPKFFIAYGKFVVVSAHNLVSIGDIVHRNITKEELREKILRCTDALSDALKTCVHKSKRAAAHFPSVTAVQEMVDSVVDISHLASDLKTAMLQAVQLTI